MNKRGFKVGDYFRFPETGNVYRVDGIERDHYKVTPVECNDPSKTIDELRRQFGLQVTLHAELFNEYVPLKRFDKDLEELLK